MKKLICLTICIALMMSFMTICVNAATFSYTGNESIYSEAMYLYNLDTKEVVMEKNADKRLVPASLTKIMTAIILIEKYKDNIGALSTTYVSGTSACFDELYMTGCSTADIQIGEMVSYKDLLYALMLRSACEAANIIAYNVAGSLSAFADMMNDKAAELGCENTHFTNAHGLFWENHYTTAHDMAIITEYALSLPMFQEISCSPTYTMEATSFHTKPRIISHTNFMLSKEQGGSNYCSYVRGIKTGTLDEAGRCLVTMALKDGYSYLLVTLNAPQKDENGLNRYYNFEDHKNIYEWAFANLRYTDIILGTEEKIELPVEYGEDRDYVILKPNGTYSAIWDKSVPMSAIHEVITTEKNIVAPVKAGDKLGTIELQYNGKTLTTLDLIAIEGLERSKEAETLTVAKSYIGSPESIRAAQLLIGFFLVYTILIIILKIIVHNYNKKNSRMYGSGRVKRYKR